MFKVVLGLGAFMLIFSFVWITATANGFEALHANSEAVRSLSNTLYCGGSTFSISYGSYQPNPNNPNKSGGRSFTALCTSPDGTETNVSNLKGLLDVGIFLLLFIGSFVVIGWGFKLWIKVPIPASNSSETVLQLSTGSRKSDA